MNWKALVLAGTATLALTTAPSAFAQNGTTDTAPAATDTTTSDMATKPDAATPKKHHKHKMKASMSASDEEAATAKLNEQQLQNAESGGAAAGATMNAPAAPAPAAAPAAPAPAASAPPADNAAAPASPEDAQKPLMGGQESSMPAPADHGNATTPAAQSDKMGNGDTKKDDMKDMKDMKDKTDDATKTPPSSTTPMP